MSRQVAMNFTGGSCVTGHVAMSFTGGSCVTGQTVGSPKCSRLCSA